MTAPRSFFWTLNTLTWTTVPKYTTTRPTIVTIRPCSASSHTSSQARRSLRATYTCTLTQRKTISSLLRHPTCLSEEQALLGSTHSVTKKHYPCLSVATIIRRLFLPSCHSFMMRTLKDLAIAQKVPNKSQGGRYHLQLIMKAVIKASDGCTRSRIKCTSKSAIKGRWPLLLAIYRASTAFTTCHLRRRVNLGRKSKTSSRWEGTMPIRHTLTTVPTSKAR